MNDKLAIVNAMVENGYHLFDESAEHFAARFDLETLKKFYDAFMRKGA